MNSTLAVFVAAVAASAPTMSAQQHLTNTTTACVTPSEEPFFCQTASNRSFAAGQENPSAVQTADPSHADAIRQRVKEGQKVRVTDDQGREWQGRIDRFAPDNLELLTNDRQRRDLPYSSILRIDRPRDTLANGAKIGFVSGAAFGLFLVVANETTGWDLTAAQDVLVPAAYGGAGAGIGIAIDALVRRNPTLFRRGDSRVMLAPSLGRGVRGLRLSVQW